MEKPPLYDFESFPAFFTAFLETLRATDRRFSLRWLAKRLEIKSHTHLLSLANGTKVPTDELLDRLVNLVGFTVDEAAYIKAMASLQRARQPQERAFLLERISGLRRRTPDTLVAIDAFEMISHWYHLAIFEMVALPDFRSEPEWMAARLGHAVDATCIKESLTRLIRLGLLREGADGTIERAVDQFNTTHNVPSTAVRTFHAEMLGKAKEALETVPVDKRSFIGRTMLLDSRKLEEASELMIEFRARFHKLMESSEPDGVYYLGLHLVPLTRSASRMI